MALPMHQLATRLYSYLVYPLGPKLGMKAVANVVKCNKKTLKYWLERLNEAKDLTDLQRSGRPRNNIFRTRSTNC